MIRPSNPHGDRKLRIVGSMLFSLAMLWGLQTVIMFPVAASAGRPLSSLIGTPIYTCILCAILVYAGRKVRRGTGIGGTLALTAFLSFQALVCGTLLLACGRNVPTIVAVILALYALIVFSSFGILLLVWARRDNR